MSPAPHLDNALGPEGSVVTYQVTLAGHLDDHWSEWLGGSSLVRNDDASTTLTVTAVDQAQLHGVLAGIRDLGVRLLSLQPVDSAPEVELSPAPQSPSPSTGPDSGSTPSGTPSSPSTDEHTAAHRPASNEGEAT